jgi:hypothetical protein
MGSPFYVGNAPGGASYQGPNVNFDWLGGLLKDYAGGQQMRSQLEQLNAFRGGVPRDDQGNIDTNAVVDKAARSGGMPALQGLMPYLIAGQQGRQAYGDIAGTAAPGGITANTGPATSSNAAGPANLRPRQQATGGPPFAPGGGRGDNGQTTLMSVVTDTYGPEAAGNVAARAAKAFGIADPNAPLDPQTLARVRQAFAGRGQTGAPQPSADQGSVPATGQSEDTAQPAQATSPAEQQVNGSLPAQAAGAVQSIENSPDIRGLRNKATFLRARAGQMLSNPMTKEQGAAYLDQAKALEDRANRIVEAAKGAAEPTPAMKDAQSTDVMRRAGQLEEQKNTIAQSQKTYNGMQAQTAQYERDLKPYLTLSRSLLNSPEIYTGIAGKLSLDINRVRAVFGDQKAALLQEALQKVTATSVLGQINQQRDQLMEAGANSGRIFAQQVDLVEKAAPQMATTPGGNRFLVEVTSRMGELQSEVTRQARAYIQAHGHLDPGFDQQMSTYMKAHPVFTPQELAHPELLGAPSAPPGASRPQFLDWARKMGMHSGDAFRTPSGDIKAVP